MKNPIRTSFIYGIIAIAVMATGCATAPKGPTDEEMVMKRLQEGVAAMKAKDYTAFDKLVSSSFSSSAVGDKASLLELMKTADNMGFADSFEADLSQAKTVINGNKCTIGPITASCNAGSITITGHGAKENGVWMVSGGELE